MLPASSELGLKWLDLSVGQRAEEEAEAAGAGGGFPGMGSVECT